MSHTNTRLSVLNRKAETSSKARTRTRTAALDGRVTDKVGDPPQKKKDKVGDDGMVFSLAVFFPLSRGVDT